MNAALRVLCQIRNRQVAKLKLAGGFFARKNQRLEIFAGVEPYRIVVCFEIPGQSRSDRSERNSRGDEIDRMIRNGGLNVVAHGLLVQQMKIVEPDETAIEADRDDTGLPPYTLQPSD